MKFWFHVLLVIILSGCSNPGDELSVINIDVNKTSEFALAEIADSVIAIPLETNSSCLLSFVRKVKFSDQHIFIGDNQNLYKFDYNGRFINKIIKAGRGPGETTNYFDFFIEQDCDIIDILAYKKLLRLHGDGQLIQEIPITGFPEQIQMIDTSFWINTCDFLIPGNDGKRHNISKMVRFNSEFIPVDTFVVQNITNEAASSDPTAVFYSFSGSTLYFYYPSLLIEPITRDTLFEFTDNVFVPAYKLRFGDRLYELNRTQQFDREKPPFKKFRINSIFVSSSFLFSSYSVENNDYFFCNDIKSGKSYNMLKGFIDDTYNTGNIQLKQFNFETNRMFFVKDGIEAAGKVKCVDENSNPVIFIVYLKD